MSRNFELLQRIGKEQEYFEAPEDVLQPADEPAVAFTAEEAPAPVPEIGSAPLDLDAGELEEVGKLVQRVFLLPGIDSPRSVVFVGTEPGNGCSWMCARAAEVLAAQVTGSVCLVDANLREPALHEMFGVPNHHGLSDALRFTEPIRSFTQTLSRRNLHLVSCGSAAETWQSLIGSERMRLRLAELRTEFDYVLIDTPAMSGSNDAVALGAAADGVVLVLKANSSRRESARKVVSELQAAKARVLGAVLNQRTFPIPDAIYNKL